MAAQRTSTRQRLIHAALELFAAQGVTETTTRQIAELAEVNEVTLFRHFGSKHGLLLAVIEDSSVFMNLGQTLIQQANQASSIYQALKDYATACLQAMERVPEVVRSVVGEAGQYPSENRQALGRGFTQANHYVAEYLDTVIQRGQLKTHVPAEKLASLLNGMLLGYAVIEFTSEFHELWQSREDFLESLIALFLHGAVSQGGEVALTTVDIPSAIESGIGSDRPDTAPDSNLGKVADLPASLVHQILQQAKRQGMQEYALAYVLFATGLNATEISTLERSHYLSSSNQQLLQINQGTSWQRPINHWILGKRYGSASKNPLTQWLKSRKDHQSALFITATEQPLSEAEIRQHWQRWTTHLQTPEGHCPAIEQAQQTWCVEMLVRGLTLEELSVLTGWNLAQLQPFARRAREKAILDQALHLDQEQRRSS